jgi:hypothetical protein
MSVIVAQRPTPHGASERGATRTDIPARLDRLPWCRFHVLIILALGVTWILDGLEVTVVGSIGPVLQNPDTLALSAQQIGAAASSYVVGAVCGALVFGWLTDRFGRRFVFYVTLIVYLTGSCSPHCAAVDKGDREAAAAALREVRYWRARRERGSRQTPC